MSKTVVVSVETAQVAHDWLTGTLGDMGHVMLPEVADRLREAVAELAGTLTLPKPPKRKTRK